MNKTPKAMTKEDLRVWLARKNTKLADVARRLGFHPGTVHVAVFRYLDTDREPRPGSITAQIIDKLREEVSPADVGPSIDPRTGARAASA